MTIIPDSYRSGLILLSIGWTCVALLVPTPLLAQVSPEEHAKHHPDQAKAAEESKGGGMMGGMMGGEGGGMMEGGMGGMMEKMGAPKPKEMYPRLMDLPDLPMEERATIEQEAHQRMMDGTKLLSFGLDALSTAASTDNFQTMQDATAQMREGLAQFESGLAAHRAIAEGKSPRNVALQWFKREMNLLPPATANSGFRLFGMTAFHTSIMVVLTAFTAAMVWMYYFKMRRAAALMKQLVTATPDASIAAPALGAHVVTSRLTSAPPAVSPLPASPIDSAAADCCDDSAGVCASVDVVGDRPDISHGMLQVVKRKLCRLRVARIYQETSDVKTFRFVACHGGPLPFNYFPGQFLTLTLPTGDKPIRRSYTISSPPTQGYYCEITVKRENQGAGSRYLHDKVKEGDTLEVQAPSGKFIFTGQESDSVVLISGGVGITPMMSITRALTDMGWHGEIYFIAACRDPEHFIFEAELKRLRDRHPNLHVLVAMSRVKEPVGDYHAGRLSKQRLAEWVPDITSKLIHLCGAPPMMDSTKQMLADLGVRMDSIHTEDFGSQQKPRVKAAQREKAGTPATTKAAATVNFAASGASTPFLPDETILEASERVGVEIDSSCRTGMCGVCKVKLLSGRVTMEVDEGLDPDEKAAGMILACQAKSTGDVAVEA